MVKSPESNVDSIQNLADIVDEQQEVTAAAVEKKIDNLPVNKAETTAEQAILQVEYQKKAAQAAQTADKTDDALGAVLGKINAEAETTSQITRDSRGAVENSSTWLAVFLTKVKQMLHFEQKQAKEAKIDQMQQ